MSKLQNIQILRALAALGVVFYHDGIETTRICAETSQSCYLNFEAAGLGVQLFFIISGFIMVTTSWNSFAKPGAGLEFLRRRIQRIVPLYWLVTTIAVIGVIAVPTMLNIPVLDFGYIAASYLFWPVSRVNGLVRPIANLGWTLNIEMMFYVVFAFSLFFDRLRGLMFAMGFLCLFTLAQMTGVFAPGGTVSSTALNFWSDPIILYFVAGMIVAVFFKRGASISPTACFLLIGFGVLFALAAGSFADRLAAFPENHVISRLVAMPALLCLFLAATLGQQIDGSKMFWRAGLLIGDASYSLYLIHPFFLRALAKFWVGHAGHGLPVWIFSVVGISLALFAGIATYLAVERPISSYFAGRRRKAERIWRVSTSAKLSAKV